MTNTQVAETCSRLADHFEEEARNAILREFRDFYSETAADLREWEKLYQGRAARVLAEAR